jgi:hypothetical protein
LDLARSILPFNNQILFYFVHLTQFKKQSYTWDNYIICELYISGYCSRYTWRKRETPPVGTNILSQKINVDPLKNLSFFYPNSQIRQLNRSINHQRRSIVLQTFFPKYQFRAAGVLTYSTFYTTTKYFTFLFF